MSLGGSNKLLAPWMKIILNDNVTISVKCPLFVFVLEIFTNEKVETFFENYGQ